MKHTRTVAAAVLAVAALATPAAAEPTVPQNGIVYSVSTTHPAAATRIDATCVFVADRWTAEYGATRVEVFATTAAAVQVEVRCQLFQNGWNVGDDTWWANGPVLHGTGRMGHLPPRNVVMCVEATALFHEQYVSTPPKCKSI